MAKHTLYKKEAYRFIWVSGMIFIIIWALTTPLQAAVDNYASLKSRIEVEGPMITLGDLFIATNLKADVIVAEAPAPGRRMSLSPRHVAMIARANGLVWKNLARLDRIIVSRKSKTISKDTILGELRHALQDAGAPDLMDVQLADRNFALHVATDVTPMIVVENLIYDSESGQFEAHLVTESSYGGDTTLISGRAYPAIEVPTLTTSLNKGDVINASDVQWTLMRLDRVGQHIVTDARDLIGKAVKRRTGAGRTLRSSDVQNPVIVEKGNLVTIIYKSANMTLSAEGRALHHGGRNDTIQVLNTRSNRNLRARVIGPNQVIVSPHNIQLSAY